MPSNKHLLQWCDRYEQMFAAAGLPPPQIVLMHPMTMKNGKARKVPAIKWKTGQGCTAATRQLLQKSSKTYGGLSLVTGRKGGIWVVDIDRADNGVQAWETLMDTRAPIVTWVQDSPNDGFHLFFRYEDKYDCLSIDAKLEGKGIDYRCNDGIIVVQPSFNVVANKAYMWRSTDVLATCPDWLGDYCIKNRTAKGHDKRKRDNTEDTTELSGKRACSNDPDYWGRSKYPRELVPYSHIAYMLEMLSPMRYDSYNSWASIGLLLSRIDPSYKMFELFSEISLDKAPNYTWEANEAKWRELCKAGDNGHIARFATLIDHVQEDNHDLYMDYCRSLIFNMHNREVWESHSRWFDIYDHTELDDLGKELLEFHVQMYIRKTLAFVTTGNAVIVQKKRNDKGEFFYQETPIQKFKSQYRNDLIRCQSFSSAEVECEEDEGNPKRGRPVKQLSGLLLMQLLAKDEMRMRWSTQKWVPYTIKFPWRVQQHDFNTFTYFKAQHRAEQMYCDGIRPNMKYIAKLFWHIRHVWASVPLDHKCETGCSEECCKHYEFLRSHLLFILQHPGTKTGVGVILRSDIPGAGKSKIFYWLWKSVFGYEYGQIMTKACALTSNFNARSERAKLTVGDDIKSIKGGLGEEMLGLITQEEQRLEKKSVDAKYVADYQEVFLLTNQDDPPVPIRVWDRRWFIISVSCMFAHKREGGIVPEFNEEGVIIGMKRMTPTEY